MEWEPLNPLASFKILLRRLRATFPRLTLVMAIFYGSSFYSVPLGTFDVGQHPVYPIGVGFMEEGWVGEPILARTGFVL